MRSLQDTLALVGNRTTVSADGESSNRSTGGGLDLISILTAQHTNALTLSSIPELLASKKESKIREKFFAELLQRQAEEAAEEDAEGPVGSSLLSRLITKPLAFIGRRVISYIVRPILTAAGRAFVFITRILLRTLVTQVIVPVATAIFGFIMSNPITAAIALAVGGLAYMAYKVFFDKKPVQSVMDRWEHAQSADAFVDEDIKTPVIEEAPSTTLSKSVGIAESILYNKPAELGFISKKEESGGRGVATVSSGKGDFGGVSYGAHQLASNNGSMSAFLRSQEGAPYSKYFSGMRPGTPEFNRVYKNIAASQAEAFGNAQHAYIVRTHYGVMAAKLRTLGIDVNRRSLALKEAVFSAAVQYGPNSNVVRKAWEPFANNFKAVSDAELIEALYAYKYSTVSQYFKNSVSQHESLRARVLRERNAVLALNSKEVTSVNTPKVALQDGVTVTPDSETVVERVSYSDSHVVGAAERAKDKEFIVMPNKIVVEL